MKVRDCLGNSVLGLCILSFVSFALIFIVTVLLSMKNNDQIINNLPLSDKNFQQWGNIPGALNYTHTKEITLFGIENYTASSSEPTMFFKSQSPLKFNVAKNFIDLVPLQQSNNIEYTVNTVYSSISNPEEDLTDVMT